MEVEAHGKQAHDDNGARTNDTRPYVVEAQEFVAHPIEDTTNYARKGIDFLAENEGFDVDEYITEHTAARTRERTHKDGCPVGETVVEGLLNPGNGEDGKTDGVEDEPRVVLLHQVFAEHDHPEYGEGADEQISGVLQPEDGHVEHNITRSTTTNSRGDTYDVSTEKVKALCRSEAHTRDGECKRTDVVACGVEADVE